MQFFRGSQWCIHDAMFFVVSPQHVWWWFIHVHTNWLPQVVAWYQLMGVCKTFSKTLGTCFHSISHFNPQLTWPFAHGRYCLFVMRGDYLRTISASTVAAPLNPCRKFTFSYTKWSLLKYLWVLTEFHGDKMFFWIGETDIPLFCRSETGALRVDTLCVLKEALKKR